MLKIYPTAHSGIQKHLFKTTEMTVNTETTMVNCWLGLACVPRKWCAHDKIPGKIQSKNNNFLMLTKITKHACHNDSIYVACQLVLV